MAANPVDPTELSDLIDLVYDSALAKAQWQDLTDRLYSMFPQACFTITGFDGVVGMPNLVQSGFSEAERRFYLEKIAPRNEVAKFIVGQPTGKLITQVVSREEFAKTVFYREWLEPRGYGATSSVLLASHEQRFVVFTSSFPWDVQDEMRERLDPLLLLLIPHIIRAMEIARTIKLSRALSERLSGLLDTVIYPMLVLDRNGGFHFANSSGQRMLDNGHLFHLNVDGTLRMDTAELTENLQTLIRNAASDIFVAAQQIEAPDGPLTLCVTPFRIQMSSEDIIESALYDNDERFAVFIGQRGQSEINLGLLQDVFGLTRREAEVGRDLLSGRTPQEIAQGSGRSERTIRNQIQTLYDKVGVKRQAELIDALRILQSVDALFGAPIQKAL